MKDVLDARLRDHVKKGVGVSNIAVGKLVRLGFDEGRFDGVFLSDKIPPRLAYRAKFSIIVNLSTSDTKKSERGHFVAVVGSEKCVRYIDSFGKPCDNSYVRGFLDSCRRPVIENRRRLQDTASSMCSFYAMLFAIYFSDRRRYRFPLYFYKGKKYLKKNDDLCYEYLLRVLYKRGE